MSNGVKAVLWIAGILIVCYALNISPTAILADLFHGLQQMHNTSGGGHG